MPKIKDLIDPQLVSDVVDEIVSELKGRKGGRGEDSVQMSIPQVELVKIRARLENLEKSYEISETEDVRNVTEKVENLREGIEAQIATLEGQLNDLRTAMIRLSGEVKRLRDQKSF